MKKILINDFPKKAYELFRPTIPMLVTSKNKNGSLNVAPFSWITPISAKPLYLLLALLTIPRKQDSLKNIERTGEFGAGLPQIDLADKLMQSSFNYPENISKFDFLSLTEEQPVKISTGLIKECRANFECKVERSELIGDHTLLIAKVLAIHYEEELHRSDLVVDLNKATPCIHYRKSVYKNSEKHIFLNGTNELLEIEKQIPTLDFSGQEKNA